LAVVFSTTGYLTCSGDSDLAYDQVNSISPQCLGRGGDLYIYFELK